jgi:tRNA threonylcarbamoyladenosine biosynthesis protein TsaB
MKILALEFSSAHHGVAVLQKSQGNASVDSIRLNEVIESAGLNSRVIGMIDEALQGASVEREQIDVLAIGLGPGSYSGIRRAIAAAQGWQLADQGIKFIGISSADCLIAQALEEGIKEPFNIVIDARRGEYYLASCTPANDGNWNIAPLRLATLQELEQCVANGEKIIGPDIASSFRSGSLKFPRAATLARLALRRHDFVTGEALEPLYLRQPQFVKTQKQQAH